MGVVDHSLGAVSPAMSVWVAFGEGAFKGGFVAFCNIFDGSHCTMSFQNLFQPIVLLNGWRCMTLVELKRCLTFRRIKS